MTTMMPRSSLVLLLFFFLCNISLSKALKGFSVEIIHRDSEKSPFYSPSETHSQRVANAIQRSIARAHYFTKPSLSLDSVQSTVIPNSGEYLMTYSIGTPPFPILGIVDTGSNIVWLQCQPCISCYRQNKPIFDPSKSSTYKTLPCSSRQCPRTTCSEDGKTCEYSIRYGDGSQSSGDISVDTITLGSTQGSPVKFPNVVVGCGHDNSGTFQANGSGIVGLSSGSTSLITQLSSTIEGKFSYCLTPLFSQSSSSSKLNFGDAAVVSGSRTVSTPLVQKEDQIFYFLTLERLSVGSNVIAFEDSSFESGSPGNIIIDSGTTLTLLPSDVNTQLESAVAKVVRRKRVDDPNGFLSLCYEATDDDEDLPVITAHFTGADVKLKPSNTFIEISDGVLCLAFRPSADISIFGNVAQQNFLIGYDVQKQTLSFKPTNCEKE